MVQWQAFMTTNIDFYIIRSEDTFLAGSATVSFSKATL
jgi:hypothetical protein